MRPSGIWDDAAVTNTAKAAAVIAINRPTDMLRTFHGLARTVESFSPVRQRHECVYVEACQPSFLHHPWTVAALAGLLRLSANMYMLTISTQQGKTNNTQSR